MMGIIICVTRGASKIEILSGFSEHPAVANTCAIALLASPEAIPHVFQVGVNSAHDVVER